MTAQTTALAFEADARPARAPRAPERLRVAFVFRAPLGGLFRNVCDLARELDARGHAVGVVCDEHKATAHAEGALRALEPSLKLGLGRVPMRRAPHPSDVRAFRATVAALREWQVDVVHGHGSKGGVYARLAGARLGVTRAYTPHGGSFHFRPGSAVHHSFMLIERALKGATDAFLFESEYMRSRVHDLIGPSRAVERVCLNGLHDAEFASVRLDPGAADLFFIGEYRFVKGLDTLLEALALVARRHNRRLRTLLIGSGPEEANLRRAVREAGLDDVVTFHAPMPIRDACRRARVMVLPSRFESLPYVAIEAAALGMPVVATRVGGLAEIFGPEAWSLLPAGDVERLAEALLNRLDEPQGAATAAIRDHVGRRFRVDAMVDGVLAGYREALERRAPASGALRAGP